jgi:hypothetical protein
LSIEHLAVPTEAGFLRNIFFCDLEKDKKFVIETLDFQVEIFKRM